jgi:molybdopterin molybdotransferase
MISYAEALELLLAQSRLLEEEWCRPSEALSRVLAEAVQAPCALPPFANAAMDGYALASNGNVLAAGSEYEVSGLIAAGTPPPADAEAKVWEITTGAALPAGLDCIVPLECVESLQGGRIRLRETLVGGRNVRQRGSDVALGEQVGAAGQRIDPALCMMLAALGIDRIKIRRRPRVALLSTGAELVADASLPLGEGRIYAANAPYLEASLRAMGAEVIANATLGDDAQAFAEQLREVATEADLVLSTGAVSMGRHDFVPASLRARDARLLFHKVAIRPGKPLLAASLPEGPLFIGLPGNPIAAAVGFRFFALPVLRAMLGMPPEIPLRVQLLESVHVAAGLRRFFKARLRQTGSSGLGVELLEGQESYRIGSLLQANAWAVLDEGANELPVGTLVDVLPRDAAGGWFID